MRRDSPRMACCGMPYLLAAAIILAAAAVHAAERPMSIVAPRPVSTAVPMPIAVATNTQTSPVSTNGAVAVPFDIKTLPSNTVFTVQLGAFKTKDRAFTAFWELSHKVPSLQLIPPFGKDKLYRVSHGSFATYDEARTAADKLHKDNIDCFVTPVGMPELAVNGPRGD